MNSNKVILAFSIPLIALLIVAAVFGLADSKLYAAESLNWQAQSFGQDIVDLFVVAPLLIIATILAYREKKIGRILWGGIVAYLLYTFTIYCFDTHFNKLFVVYCFILGLSFYATAWFVYHATKQNIVRAVNGPVHKVTGVYFIIISLLFYLLWLADIIPAIVNNQLPKSIADTGLYTNPVQVIDLSIFLPAIFLAGFMLLKKKIFAVSLALPLLVFLVLMNSTIGVLTIVMIQKGVGENIGVAYVMGAFALFTIFLLIANLVYDRTHKT